MTSAAAEIRKPILQALHGLLKPLGYRKSGNVFSLKTADVIHLIELQSSRYNTSDSCSFTINAAVFAPRAIYPDIRARTKPSVGMAQWRSRIGSLMPTQIDSWWEAHGDVGGLEIANEIAQCTKEFVLPALAGVPNLTTLIELWKSGKCPGVPRAMQQNFLQWISLE